MASSQIDICNAALGKLGQDITITSFTDQVKAAKVFSRCYDRVRDYVLADFPWAFATKAAALSPLSEPALGWQFRYDYPEDCLNARIVCDAGGVPRAISCVNAQTSFSGQYEFEKLYGTQNTSIATNLEAAYLIYSARIEDTGRYPPHFVDALACRLAIEAAPVLASEVGLRLGPALEQKYLAAKYNASARDMNESNDQRDLVSPTLASRGDGMPIQWPGCCS